MAVSSPPSSPLGHHPSGPTPASILCPLVPIFRAVPVPLGRGTEVSVPGEGTLAWRGQHFEYILWTQHQVRLYFSLTQFLNLKSQAGTSHTQAAQMGTQEAQERKVGEDSALERPLCKGGQTPSSAPGPVQPHRKQEGSAGREVLSPGSTAPGSRSRKDTVGWEPEEKQD